MSDQVMNQEDLDTLLAEAGLDAEKPGTKAAKPAAAEPKVDPSEWGLTEEEVGGTEPPKAAAAPPPPSKNAPPKKVSFEELAAGVGEEKARDLEFILDIPLQLTVEVGRTTIEIGELLSMGPGSVVELDKLAGEPLEVFANEKLVARGEAVIVNEKFGIRLTEVVSKHERVENLH